jgi:hypothetical protein
MSWARGRAAALAFPSTTTTWRAANAFIEPRRNDDLLANRNAQACRQIVVDLSIDSCWS